MFLNPETHTISSQWGWEEVLEGNGHTYGINSSDSFTGSYSPQMHSIVFIK